MILEHRIFKLKVDAERVRSNVDGGYSIRLDDVSVHARQLISCAGNGSQPLLQALGIDAIEVQYRPLKQVIVRPRHQIPMYGHCLTGIKSSEPRLTITSHVTTQGLIWYLGGQIATRGVNRSDSDQIASARTELQTCVPWLDWQGAEYDVLTIDRAEPKQGSGLRPDEAYVRRVGDFIQCFPTKLTLAPDMGDRLLQVMKPPAGHLHLDTRHPRATVGAPPW